MSASEQGKNIVKNGSFESAELSQFEVCFWEGNGEVIVTQERSHSGAGALRISARERASATISQNLEVEPDSVYRISVWLFTENLAGPGITGLEIKSNCPQLKPYATRDQEPNDDSWHEIEVFTHTGPATDLDVTLMFESWNGGGTGTVWFDDLSVTRVARSKGAYFLKPDRPLPAGITLVKDVFPPYNDDYDTTAGWMVRYFQPSIESLKNYECPQWFRDAKFGIYLHWGVYSLAEQECWFPRLMYSEGYGEKKYMTRTYGHQSEFGYMDLIPLWKAEKFDPDRLARLFKKAGARYVTPVAVHHDNFDLYNSRYHKWNSVNFGPGKDITGLWREAILRQGLRFGVTTHLAWSYSWFGTNKGSDTEGAYKGIPYDGNDPRFWDYYHEPNGERGFYPIDPSPKWRFEWAVRTMDLVDKYKPDLLYFDGAVPFNGVDQSRTGMEVIAYYYNRNMQWHDGKLEGVMTIKQGADGIYTDGIATLDFERAKSEVALPEPWQTDDSIGPWAYRKDAQYKSVAEIVCKLVDIVSKNGNYLLNVPPKADGTLDEETERILEGIGQWMDLNGEAIYETRPWSIAEDGCVRFTRKGDMLYAIALEWPEEDGILRIPALGKEKNVSRIGTITMLGHEKSLDWRQKPEALEIRLPTSRPCENAWTFKIAFAH